MQLSVSIIIYVLINWSIVFEIFNMFMKSGLRDSFISTTWERLKLILYRSKRKELVFESEPMFPRRDRNSRRSVIRMEGARACSYYRETGRDIRNQRSVRFLAYGSCDCVNTNVKETWLRGERTNGTRCTCNACSRILWVFDGDFVDGLSYVYSYMYVSVCTRKSICKYVSICASDLQMKL